MRRVSTIAIALLSCAALATPAAAQQNQPNLLGDFFGAVLGAPRPQPAIATQPSAEDLGPTTSRIPREMVAYSGPYAPGTVVVNTAERRLYYVLSGNKAIRYGIGVGRQGFEWAGTQTVSRKQEWPEWRPPTEMIQRRPDLPRYMAGGPENPLGARAMYLGSSLYRIHGSNEPDTIGHAVSSGCIRMLNEDVVDLYERVKVGTLVVVLR
jgi:lipoprotein-anchoring transpeptidase ErfK/SrfK